MPELPVPAEEAEPRPAVARPPEPLALSINGKPYFHDGDPAMPLLWFLRDVLRLTGTKYACGVGSCGACNVLLGGKLATACTTTMAAAAGHDVTTIEGLSSGELHPLQQAWIDEQVPQCGYCQNGMMIKATELLNKVKRPTEDQIKSHMNTHLCRCGTYPRITKAIKRAYATMAKGA